MTIASLATETRTQAEHARTAAVIDHTRAAAADELAALLRTAVVDGLSAQAGSGELLQRFETAMTLSAKRGLEGNQQLVGALYALLEEQGRRSGRFITDIGAQWRAHAHRAEGACRALLDVVVGIERTAPSSVPPPAPAPPVAAQGPDDTLLEASDPGAWLGGT